MSIFFTVTASLLFISVYFFADGSQINFHYISLGILIILIVNIVLFTNVGLRLYFVLSGKEEKYLKTAEE